MKHTIQNRYQNRKWKVQIFFDPAGKTRLALIGVLLKEAQKAKRKVEWSETEKS